jgi:ubiquinone/menaquinone biosynthesis C-methylase UbiE
MNEMNEELRILNEYESRDNRLRWNDWRTNIYHPRHPIGSLFHEHNHDILVSTLNRLDLDLADLKILDVGCGYGYWLRYFVELGAKPGNCFGVDLSAHRIDIAKQKNPTINWYRLNMGSLPFPNNHFDFVMQSVVFSSILDTQTRLSCASEMYRVVQKGGILLWIDLTNTSTDLLVGFSGEDVQEYFPKMQTVDQRRVHPKYFRRLNGKHAWLAKCIYHFTKYGCESTRVILRKPLDE